MKNNLAKFFEVLLIKDEVLATEVKSTWIDVKDAGVIVFFNNYKTENKLHALDGYVIKDFDLYEFNTELQELKNQILLDTKGRGDLRCDCLNVYKHGNRYFISKLEYNLIFPEF